MSIEKRDFFVPSSDGVHTLAGVIYQPSGEARGFFQIVHGMTEHIARYEKIMFELAEAGWLCFGYDNLGHGHTVKEDSELGFIAGENGYDLLVRDVKAFSDAVFSEFGREEKPYCLMGHSMGSFIVRLAAERYVQPDRLIVMGTSGANPAAGAGLALIAVIKTFFGENHISNLIESIAFGSYNKRFGGGTKDDPKPWLTTDEAVRRRYYADKFCTFRFTVSAMGDLIRLIKLTNRAEWYRSLPKDMSVLLISGEEDPVGNYGKGVREVESALLAEKMAVECVLYAGARHEILNDFTYEAVKETLLEFCEKE